MGKIIKLKTDEDNIQDFLDEIKECVKVNKIDNLWILKFIFYRNFAKRSKKSFTRIIGGKMNENKYNKEGV